MDPLKPLLSVRSVTFSYEDAEIIKDVSFELASSEAVAVMGPSGSGKSTLFRIIAGLQRPDQGRCELDGVPINGIQKGVFLGFQAYDAFPWYTVTQNVGLASSGASTSGSRDASIREILAAVGLSESGDKYPRELSGGMQKRLALARCLAAKARLIILDEPFSSLDSRSRRALQILTRELAEASGRGLLLCTHDPYEAAIVADRVIICSDRPLTVRRCIDVQRVTGASVAENLLLAERVAHEITKELDDMA